MQIPLCRQHKTLDKTRQDKSDNFKKKKKTFDHFNMKKVEHHILSCILALGLQFVISNPRQVPWNWIAFYHNSFAISPDLDATMDNMQTRPLRQILLYPRNNSLAD